MENLNRDEVSKMSEMYAEVLQKETHHKHELVMVDGVVRWKELDGIRPININTALEVLYKLGYDKNTEIYRKFYRDLGYSLYGYWEIFYWELNNGDASNYKPTNSIY